MQIQVESHRSRTLLHKSGLNIHNSCVRNNLSVHIEWMFSYFYSLTFGCQFMACFCLCVLCFLVLFWVFVFVQGAEDGSSGGHALWWRNILINFCFSTNLSGVARCCLLPVMGMVLCLVDTQRPGHTPVLIYELCPLQWN